MYFDRFDIVEAHYLFYYLYHDGQWSEGYRRLSKIMSYFSPRFSLSDENNLNENAREIFDALVEKHQLSK